MDVKVNKLRHIILFLIVRPTTKIGLIIWFFALAARFYYIFYSYIAQVRINTLLTMADKRENRVVELAGFATAAEAEVAASMLRSMGVEVSVVNEISSIMLPYINDNRVRLLVNEADLERAKQLMEATPEE